jgi:hypothetical protein
MLAGMQSVPACTDLKVAVLDALDALKDNTRQLCPLDPLARRNEPSGGHLVRTLRSLTVATPHNARNGGVRRAGRWQCARAQQVRYVPERRSRNGGIGSDSLLKLRPAGTRVEVQPPNSLGSNRSM